MKAVIAIVCFCLASLSAGTANAFIACNHADCWHGHQKITAPGINFVYHPDDWYFHHDWHHGRLHWHDYRKGRGYWRDGVWVAA